MSDAKAKLDQVMGRAIRDEKFRQQLTDNPKEALKDSGLTDDELNAVSGGIVTNFTGITSVFQQPAGSSFLTNITRVMWCSDKVSYERG